MSLLNMGPFWDVQAVALAVGCALMFAPTWSAHVLACLVLVFALIWGAVGGIVWVRSISSWTGTEFLRLSGVSSFLLIILPAMIWFSWTSASAQSPSGLITGQDSVVMGHVPDNSRIGEGSVVIGPTDSNGNVILNHSMAVGRGACAGPGSISIGAFAGAGSCAKQAPDRR
jgi:hypothetical protein